MSKLDKTPSGEHFPKLNLKTFFYLAVLLCFSGDKKDALASISPTESIIDDCRIVRLDETIAKDSAKIRLHIVNLMAQKKSVIENFRNYKFKEQKIEDLSKVEEGELVQRLLDYYPDIDLEASFEEIIRQLEVFLYEDGQVFLGQVKDVYNTDYDFTGIMVEEINEIALCIINRLSHPLVNQFFIDMQKRIALNIDGEEFQKLYTLDFLNEIQSFRCIAYRYLGKAYLIEELFIRWGI